jgi:hypothetical protein
VRGRAERLVRPALDPSSAGGYAFKRDAAQRIRRGGNQVIFVLGALSARLLVYLLRRMSPELAPSSGRGMSAIPPLLGGKQTSGKRAKMTRVTHLRHERFGLFAARIDLLPAVANQDAVSKVGFYAARLEE